MLCQRMELVPLEVKDGAQTASILHIKLRLVARIGPQSTCVMPRPAKTSKETCSSGSSSVTCHGPRIARVSSILGLHRQSLWKRTPWRKPELRPTSSRIRKFTTTESAPNKKTTYSYTKTQHSLSGCLMQLLPMMVNMFSSVRQGTRIESISYTMSIWL